MYCPASLQESPDFRKLSAVYIVENDIISRTKLRDKINSIKKFCIVGESLYKDNYLNNLYECSPNVVIFSSFLGLKEQYEEIKVLHKQMPLVKKLVLSANVDEEEFCATIISGAKGYCSLECDINELMTAIDFVSKGNAYFDNSMSNFIHRLISHMNQMHQLPIDKPIEEQINLTERELEVISLAAQCDDYEDIGRTLCISRHTVKMHLTSIYKKLGVKNKLQAILKLQNKIYEFKF